MKDKIIDTCDVQCIHEDKVDNVISLMEDREIIEEVSELFKVMGDKTRLNILHILSICEMCVCDIAHVLSMTQSAVSHQLRVLKRAKIVKYRREGKIVYYSLDDNHIFSLLRTGIEHIRHQL